MEFPYLVWAHYINGPKQDFKLLFLLGDKGEKVIALDGKKIPHDDVGKIRTHLKELKSMSVPDRVTWIRDNVVSWRQIYKEVLKSRLIVREEYEIVDSK